MRIRIFSPAMTSPLSEHEGSRGHDSGSSPGLFAVLPWSFQVFRGSPFREPRPVLAHRMSFESRAYYLDGKVLRQYRPGSERRHYRDTPDRVKRKASFGDPDHDSAQ